MNNSLGLKKFKTLLSVKLSLISLYIALTYPMLFFTLDNLKILSIIFFFIGLFIIFSITNDYVLINDLSIKYKTSFMSNLLGKKNREILWSDIVNINSFPTSQGSKVHYFIGSEGNSFLVPQRIEKFDDFKKIVMQKTNLKKNLGYISPLWTYKLLIFISCIIWSAEIFFINIKDYQY